MTDEERDAVLASLLLLVEQAARENRAAIEVLVDRLDAILRELRKMNRTAA